MILQIDQVYDKNVSQNLQNSFAFKPSYCVGFYAAINFSQTSL